MSPAELIWYVMGGCVIAYALTAGADFGGGIWHLTASGRDKKAQRKAIEHAIGPIWEANHVWLIFVVVLLFTAFPRAFAVICTALHVPISLALLGIVMRGSAFVFHSYGLRRREHGLTWSLVFGISSLATPLMLGAMLAALSSGAIRWDGVRVLSGFTSGWTSAFALGAGLFAVVLFALLAAVYLAAEYEDDAELCEAFRVRAFISEVVAALVAVGVLVTARYSAPQLFANLSQSVWTWPIQALTAAAALSTLWLLYGHQYRRARVTVAAQVSFVLIGWGLAMRGTIVMPDVTLLNAGTQPGVVSMLVPLLAAGTALLAPALWYLMKLFKSA